MTDLNMEIIRRLIAKQGLHSHTAKWIEKAIATSFYPQRALVNFERFIEQAVESDTSLLYNLNKVNIPWIGVLFAGSQALTDMAMKSPESLFWSLQVSVLKSTRFKREMRRERQKMLAKYRTVPGEALVRFRNRELMRIGWRDLLKWADTVETLEDLSRLADVTIEGALAVAEEELEARYGAPLRKDGSPGRFIVLGMGKLGGRELNFSSDIDLIYFFDDDEGQTEGGVNRHGIERAKVSTQEYYSKVAQRMTSLMTDITPLGTLYRVDLGLRPEGNRGPIVTSLASAELYYESWGQSWERQALLKARVCAGDPTLGDDFFRIIKPFAYRKSLDYSSLTEIQQMKGKIDKELKSGKDRFRNNVKLGRGGIREIEFIIQAYQLIYGGKMPWLAETNSLKALHRIFERGLLGFEQYAILADALLFLRDLENRMQVTYGQQVQILPDKHEKRQALALKMSLPDADMLMAEYERVSVSVNEIFKAFFRDDSEDAKGVGGEFSIDLENEEEALAQLEKMRFREPRRAFDYLLHIRDGEPFNHPSTKSRILFMRLLPELMERLASLPQKDRALQNMDRFFSAQTGREGLYEILLEYPPAREVLLGICAHAQSLADVMINQPDALEILASGQAGTRAEPLSAIPDVVHTYDKRLEWLRKERNSESLRICISYLMTHNNPFALMRHLTDLADEFVKRCLEEVEKEVRRKGEVPDHDPVLADGHPRFVVIGLGKLGRAELNHGSDLDILFIYSEGKSISQTMDNQMFYTNICRKLINAIGGLSQYGVAYKVDTRLRPEGEKGTIVIPSSAAETYYERRGALWERMALCGARPVAGDLMFGKEFLQRLDSFVYDGGLSKADETTMNRMKHKMEREKIKRGTRIAIKYGQGGIVDIEFLAQKLKLAHGADLPHIRLYNTHEMLEAVSKEDWDIPGAEELLETYHLLRTVETHMRMESGLGAEALPEGDALTALEESLTPYITMKESLADTVTDAMERAKRVLGPETVTTDAERNGYIALNALSGIGVNNFYSLLDVFGSAVDALNASKERLQKVGGIGPKTAEQIASINPAKRATAELKTAENLKVRIVTVRDDDYPRNLKLLFRSPPVLYVKGEIRDDDGIAIAVVGTRSPTAYGRITAENLTATLSTRGFNVVSGLARGIDSVAHKTALRVGGRTTAVLGCSLDRCYPPENRKLFDAIAERGAVVSQFAFGTEPEKRNFPIRNRVICGLALGVLVVEAGLKSGAAITAYAALDEGREVFAVPGRIDSNKSAGTHELIKKGAKLVTRAEEVVEEFAPEIQRVLALDGPKDDSAFSADERRVLDLLDGEERHIDHLIKETGLPSGVLLGVLLELELRGAVRQLPGKLFARLG